MGVVSGGAVSYSTNSTSIPNRGRIKAKGISIARKPNATDCKATVVVSARYVTPCIVNVGNKLCSRCVVDSNYITLQILLVPVAVRLENHLKSTKVGNGTVMYRQTPHFRDGDKRRCLPV